MMLLRAGFAKKLKCTYSIFVSFRYNPTYVELIKSLSTRVFDSVSKEWEVDYNCYGELIGNLNAWNIPYNGQQFMESIQLLQQEVNEQQERLRKQNENFDISIVDTFDYSTTPFSYQKDGIRFGLTHDMFLLADEQGLGKSLQAGLIAEMKKGGNHCLIICGYDSLQFNWVQEIQKHTHEKGYVLGQRQKKRTGKIYLGTLQDRWEDIQNLDKIEEFFIITSLTTLRQCTKQEYVNKNGKTKESKDFYLAKKLEEWCRNGEIGRIIVDEAQMVKNYDAAQTQALLELKSVPYKIVTTGTPIMNRNLDLYPIMYWMGFEKGNYYQFQNRYCKMGGFQNKQVVGNKNNDELHQRLDQFMLRRLKEDVLELPEKIYIDEVLDMEGRQWALYNKVVTLLKQEMATLREQHGENNKVKLLALTLALRKITCHPGWYDEQYKDSVKYERTRQLVNEAYENGRKTIIFSNFTTPFETNLEYVNLYKQLSPFNPAMIIGDTKDRMEQVQKFQTDPSCHVIVGSIGAMGTGLTLNAASNVIFLDEPWNRALKDQACDRAHRIGTKYPVNIYTLMCRDTIDESIHNIVERKGRLADEVVDGITTEELQQLLDEQF